MLGRPTGREGRVFAGTNKTRGGGGGMGEWGGGGDDGGGGGF